MKTFQVCLHPMDRVCRVQVDGLENAKWLVSRLCQFYLVRHHSPVIDSKSDPLMLFDVVLTSSLTCSRLEKMLTRFPEVFVMKESEEDMKKLHGAVSSIQGPLDEIHGE